MKSDFFRIKVKTYDGHKGAQRPVSFVWKERSIECTKILDQWYGEDYEYFKIEADDSRTYSLRYDRKANSWELSAFKT
ncbi:MAG: hypothetical protein ABH871_03615 [Pseudomonadota bacterium]